MELGKTIRRLRLERNMTQEALAQSLNVTGQAVSKWENDMNTPDISLLPELAAVFGTTIDELFEMTEETHLRRIEKMLEDGHTLSEEEYRYGTAYLSERLNSARQDARYHGLLSELYHQKARDLDSLARCQAERALELSPGSKRWHNALRDAADGLIYDWYLSNHSEMIEYYHRFVQQHPEIEQGYTRLLTLLLADNRTQEAREVLEQLCAQFPSCRCQLYLGRIEYREGWPEQALDTWQSMVQAEPESWLAWSLYADALAHVCQYENALNAYRRAEELQPSPKYRDHQEGIAGICEILGRSEEAAEACRRMLQLLQEDWNITEGAVVEHIQERIRRLEQRA